MMQFTNFDLAYIGVGFICGFIVTSFLRSVLKGAAKISDAADQATEMLRQGERIKFVYNGMEKMRYDLEKALEQAGNYKTLSSRLDGQKAALSQFEDKLNSARAEIHSIRAQVLPHI